MSTQEYHGEYDFEVTQDVPEMPTKITTKEQLKENIGKVYQLDNVELITGINASVAVTPENNKESIRINWTTFEQEMREGSSKIAWQVVCSGIEELENS